ncbi:MAG TPA: acyloxyacyl hydrolase [Azospirillaceae bacterium]|nr:acyloxyacyl hydrolase [Azospirillaceae bacterium]
MRLGLLAAGLLAAAGLLGTEPARADEVPRLSLGIGQFDNTTIDSNIGPFDVSGNAHDRAVDFRLEYRFGTSLLPFTEPYASVRPWLGAEATSEGGVYGGGGILVDVPLGPFIFTPSFGAGLWSSGEGKDLGSPLEFRTQVEVGYEFENQSRFSLAYSHISNADVAEPNPGANSIVVYYHLPTRWLLGR